MIGMVFEGRSESWRRKSRILLQAIVAGVGILAAAIANAQDIKPTPPPPRDPNSPQSIEQQKPAFFVYVEADRESLEYYVGEQISIKVRCEVDAFIYVLYTQADGKTYVVFPNSATPDNRVAAKQTVQLPGANDTFRWTVSAPFGKEQMKVIASKDRIPTLEKPEFRRNSLTSVTGQDVAAIAQQLKTEIPADKWSEVSLEITTHDGVNPQSPYSGKRFGAFFSIPYQLDSIYIKKAELKIEPTGNLGGGPLSDAHLFRRTLSRQGGLDDFRMYPDFKSPDATMPMRHVMHEAITQWLPSISKPGDTVIIYFSGHGAEVPDKTAPGGKYYILVPVDSLTPFGFIAMKRLKAQDKLKDMPWGDELLAQGEAILQQANLKLDPDTDEFKNLSNEQLMELLVKAERALYQQSCVTENEFGHWLQALPGRRVVVILDACRSGGFYSPESSGSPNGTGAEIVMKHRIPTTEFSFMKEQLGRLKSLGQVNTAFMAAARSDQNSVQGHRKPIDGRPLEPASGVLVDVQQELSIDENFGTFIPKDQNSPSELVGIFTYFLTNFLLKSSGPVDIESAGDACTTQMQAYFNSPEFLQSRRDSGKPGDSEAPKLKAHAPVFFDNCRPKVLLKH